MGLRKDIWRPAIAAAPVAEIVARGSLDGVALTWLPPQGSFRFLADPFGLWRDGRLHVFVEAYDYRVRIGWIETLAYSADLALVDRRPALREPWHLSYPCVFEAEGETWLLPEAHRSGRLTLYRGTDFPGGWSPAAVIALDAVAVDATPVRHDGRWWLFYAVAGSEADKMGTLHCAFADRLAGPWTPHPANPIRRDVGSGRPGGAAWVAGDAIMLPVQDCSSTYGRAIGTLRIRISPTAVTVEPGGRIVAPAAAAPFTEGLHTLSGAGPVTLVDMKRTILSAHGLAIEAVREGRKLIGRPAR